MQEGEFNAQLERAAVLCDLGRYPEAIALLKPILAADVTNLPAWCILAQANLGTGKYEAALAAAKSAISIAPDDEVPRVLASSALLGLDRHEEAVGEAREATRLAPHSALAFVHLALALATARSKGRLRRKPDLQEAQAAAEHAVALAPDDPMVHVTAGAVAVEGNRLQEAMDALHRALAIDPNDHAAQHELARLRLKSRSAVLDTTSLAAAASGFADALRADPRAQSTRRNLDLTIRSFLGRLTWLLLLDAYLVARLSSQSGQLLSRLLPMVVLAVPATFVWRFVSRLPRDLRDHAWRLVSSPGPIRRAACIELVAVGALVAGALAPQSARPGLASLAAVAALAGRAAMMVDRHRVGHPGVPVLSDGLMWFLALVFVLGAAFFGLAAVRSGAGAAGAVLAGCCIAGSAATIRSVLRRRSHLSDPRTDLDTY